MGKASPILSSFNAGELTPLLDGRSDIAKYNNGCSVQENYIPTTQGPLIRRAGFRYVAEVKNSNDRTWLIRFDYTSANSYTIEVGNRYMRFYTQRGRVLVSGVAAYGGATPYVIGDLVSSAGVNYYCIANTTGNAPPNATYWYALTGSIYEIPTPYLVADLTNSDGTFSLSMVQSADVIYIANSKYQLQKLSRFGSTRWTMASVIAQGGPFNKPDLTTTVYSSASTGNVTLTASAALWTAAHVGSMFALEEKDLRTTVQWESGKAYGINALVRSAGINYISLNAATSGTVKPVHITGAVYDGTTGVQWQYLDNGIGWAQITGYTSPTVVSASVQSRIPDNAVGVGNATKYWGQSLFNAVDGYPSEVTFFHERLTLARTQDLALSVSGDYENFAKKDPAGNIVADMGIKIQVVSRKRSSILWLEPGSDLLIGTAGGEFVCKETTRNQVFGAGNTTITLQSEFGASTMRPNRVGYSVVFLQRAGTKIREMSYEVASDSYRSNDTTLISEHITNGGVCCSSFQQDPYSIIWYARNDGMLLGFTFNKEQDVTAWHRHPVGGSAIVEALTSISSPDGTRSDLWAINKRTVGGVTKRYIEFMEAEHRAGNDPHMAFYLDSGLTYDGKVNSTLTPGASCVTSHATGVPFVAGTASWSAGDIGREIHYRYQTIKYDAGGQQVIDYQTGKAVITAYTDSTHVTCTINNPFPSTAVIAANLWRMGATSISGLSHLEGKTVDVLVDGATHPKRVVTTGAISLQSQGSIVHVGLPCPSKMRTMRLNAGAQDGTSQGKVARVNKVAIRLYETLGIKFGENFTALDEVNFRTPSDQMDEAPPLFSGDVILDWPGDYDTHPWLCFMNDQPLPSCIIGLMPQVTVQDR